MGRAFLSAQTPVPRAKLEYTSLAAAFCVLHFTIAELRRIYSTTWGVELDPRNFHRKVTTTKGFVVRSGGTTSRGSRPAQLYREGASPTRHSGAAEGHGDSIGCNGDRDAQDTRMRGWISAARDHGILPAWRPNGPLLGPPSRGIQTAASNGYLHALQRIVAQGGWNTGRIPDRRRVGASPREPGSSHSWHYVRT